MYKLFDMIANPEDLRGYKIKIYPIDSHKKMTYDLLWESIYVEH